MYWYFTGQQLCGIFLKTKNAGIPAITERVHDMVVPVKEIEVSLVLPCVHNE